MARSLLAKVGRGGRASWLAVLAIVLVWMLSGFYRVGADQQGVEFLFGAYVRTTNPGLNYWLPSPIGSVLRPVVTRTNQVTIGFNVQGGTEREVVEESHILSGDQNIIDIHFVVQWRINNAADYLFNLRDVDGTIKIAAESALREVVGANTLTAVLTNQRDELAARAGAILQSTLDSYKAGVTILDLRIQKADPPKEVLDAFNDVQRAKQDADRLANEALAYRNSILPVARGEAARVVQSAAAEKEKLIRESEGEAARFTAFYETYAAGRDITTRRLYIETMEHILKRSNTIIMDPRAKGVVPYLRLPGATRPAPPAPTPAPAVEEKP